MSANKAEWEMTESQQLSQQVKLFLRPEFAVHAAYATGVSSLHAVLLVLSRHIMQSCWTEFGTQVK